MMPEAAKEATVTVQKSKGAATETPMKGATNRNVSLIPVMCHIISNHHNVRQLMASSMEQRIQRNVRMYFILLLGIVNKIRIWSFF